MEAFMDVSLGMANQLGVANTNEIMAFNAKRPFHTLLDPAVNHYLIGQYCYPMAYTNGSWVADWGNFQSNYLTLPSGWGVQYSTDSIRGFQWLSATSFMTPFTVDGYNGQTAWTWFKANKPYASTDMTVRWSIQPSQ